MTIPTNNNFNFSALRKMRKLDEVASSIGHDAKTNIYQRARRIPISIMKLKSRMSSREECTNKLQKEEIQMGSIDRNLNKQGNVKPELKCI